MRSALSLAVIVVFSFIAAISCQKELYPDLLAKISLQDTSGNCLPMVVKGIYHIDSAFTTENYIEAQINVSVPGNYYLLTNTVNGFSFKGQGQIDSAGMQTIRLTANGKPLEAGTFTFTIYYGGSTCTIDIIVSSPATEAAYAITNGSGDCPDIDIQGTYMQAVPTDSTNYVSLDVHVTKTGAYTLQTKTVSGISFAGSGNFTDTGMQRVVLKASGTPVTDGDLSVSFLNNSSTCNIELTVKPESNDPAVYTINCASVQLSGNYTTGEAMNAANTATMYVTVTTPGKFDITTTTVNGISFSNTGRFTSASSIPAPVVLKAVGTPQARGNFDYPVTANGNSCSFPVTFTGPAVFTLAGAPNACATAVVNGTYNKGSALSNSNTVAIKADVTATGSYNITTGTVNGMNFSASGTFIATGMQDIVLTGNGIPAAAGLFSFTPQAGTTSCSFDVTVTEPPVDAGVFTCKIDGVFTAFNDRAHATHEPVFGLITLALDGFTAPANGGNVPELQIFISNNNGSAVKPGTYNVDGYLVPGYMISIDYEEVDGSGTVTRWNSSSSILSPSPPFTIIVSSISDTRVKGTFSGEVTDLFNGSTKRKKITEGTFDLPIQ
jgi:hypothetical protein